MQLFDCSGWLAIHVSHTKVERATLNRAIDGLALEGLRSVGELTTTSFEVLAVYFRYGIVLGERENSIVLTLRNAKAAMTGSILGATGLV